MGIGTVDAKLRVFTASLGALLLSVTACGGGTPARPDEAITDPSGAAASFGVAHEVGRAAPGAVAADPESVVVAADLIVNGGDLESALSDGTLSQADVEAAIDGLEDGTLAGLFD